MNRLVIVVLAAFASSASLAQSELTRQDVEGFVTPLADRAERAVADGNWRGIQTFIEEHVSPDATLAFRGSLTTKVGPVMTYALTMTGREYARFAGLMTMAPHMGDGASPVGDYSASVRLGDVHVLPNGEASATVVFFESGTLDLSSLAGGAGGPQDGAAAGSTVFAASATCELRLAGSADDVSVTMAACETYTSI